MYEQYDIISQLINIKGKWTNTSWV